MRKHPRNRVKPISETIGNTNCHGCRIWINHTSKMLSSCARLTATELSSSAALNSPHSSVFGLL